jgi:hypothetical protein
MYFQDINLNFLDIQIAVNYMKIYDNSIEW